MKAAKNKSESKYFNTALRMDEALLRLLEKKDFEFITVKELCAAAKVNRSTFYLHYENTYDLLVESIEILNRRFLDSFSNLPNHVFAETIAGMPEDKLYFITDEYLLPYLAFVKRHLKQSANAPIYSMRKNPIAICSIRCFRRFFRVSKFPRTNMFIVWSFTRRGFPPS